MNDCETHVRKFIISLLNGKTNVIDVDHQNSCLFSSLLWVLIGDLAKFHA